MYLSDLLASLRRRWYVVVAGLLVTAGLCVGALRIASPAYTATSSVLLLPPTSTVGTGGNPYLSLGGLQGAADVLARAMTNESTVAKVTPAGSKATFTFEPDATTSAPMLVVEARDTTPAGAVATLDRILSTAPAVLDQLQTEVGAPKNSLISLGVLTHPTTADTDRKSQIRSLIVAAVGGLALTVLLASLIDAFVLRRRARRSEPAAAPAADGPTRRRAGLRNGSVEPVNGSHNGEVAAAARRPAAFGMRPSRPGTADRPD